MIKAFFSAVRTLTIIPIPGKDTDNFAHILPFFPLVGIILGGLVYGILLALNIGPIHHSLLIVTLTLLTQTILTGGLHIDGLGDIADGFGSGKSGDDLFRICKDSRMGTYGICALIFDILIKVFTWNILYEKELYWVILISIVIARNIQVLFILVLPLAKKTTLLSTLKKTSLGLTLYTTAMITLSLLVCVWFCGWSNTGILIAVPLVGAFFFALLCLGKIKGITGDCVGAVNEISEILVLLAGTAIVF